MINKDKIFEMLGVKAGESFRIKEEPIEGGGNIYHFDTDFYLWHNMGSLGSAITTSYSLLDFLNGNCHIEKLKTMTSSDKIILEYAKLCGGKYIAKDKDGDIYFYSSLPTKENKRWWYGPSVCHQIYSAFSLCSWEDSQPLCVEDALANYIVKDD